MGRFWDDWASDNYTMAELLGEASEILLDHGMSMAAADCRWLAQELTTVADEYVMRSGQDPLGQDQ